MLTAAAPTVKLAPDTTPEQQSCAQDIDQALAHLLEPRRAASRTLPSNSDRSIRSRRSSSGTLLTMGLALLRSFLAASGDGDVGPTLTIPGERPDEPPQVLPRLDEPRSRPYLSIFGEVTIERVGYGEDRLDAAPLDARLASAPTAILPPAPEVAGGLRHRRCPRRGRPEAPDDPGDHDPGQSLRGPEPGAGQRRGTVPGPPAGARAEPGGVDRGGHVPTARACR